MPNDGNYPQQIETNLKWCEKTFQNLGFKTIQLVSSNIPHLYAEYITDPKKPNVLFYLQIDGQPVDKSAWDQPNPFDPIIRNEKGEVVQSINGAELSKFPKEKIHNHYVAKVKPGKHSLIIPLGSKADLTIDLKDNFSSSEKISVIKLTDISGAEWIAKIK